jgi:hypothetical protein
VKRYRAVLLALAAVVVSPVVASPAGATWAKSCLGYEADTIGSSGPDHFYVGERADTNHDGILSIVGLGGDDTLNSFPMTDSMGAFMDKVFFCGGDGRDTALGTYAGFNGGSGKDKAAGSCDPMPILKSVERNSC